MRLKQELAITVELVNCVLKREQLKCEASQQAKAVWEKREDFSNLKCKFPLLLNAREDEKLFYDKERVKKVKAEQVYIWQCFLRVCELKPRFCSRIGGVKLKMRDNGDLMSPLSHEAIVRPKEHAAAILAQVDREMARIRVRDHH
jgi:enhancer of polycomb-like protein